MSQPDHLHDNSENKEIGDQFDLYVQRWLEQTATKIECLDIKSADETVGELNKRLANEGLIGIPVTVSTEIPMFIGTLITDQGVNEQIIFEKDLMQQKEYDGIFKGCRARQINDPAMTLLFYDVEVSERRGGIRLQAAVDGSNLRLHYPEIDNWQEEIEAAFDMLESIDDADYNQSVRQLREAFWDTDKDLTAYMKTIAIHSIALLSSDYHVVPGNAYNNALQLILTCSLDNDRLYEVSGIDMRENLDQEGNTVVTLEHMNVARVVKPIEVQYGSYFEVQGIDGKDVSAQLYTATQPVYVFLDETARQEIAIPFRYFARIDEIDDDAAMHYEARPVQSPGSRRFAGKSSKTCGELSHEYDARHLK